MPNEAIVDGITWGDLKNLVQDGYQAGLEEGQSCDKCNEILTLIEDMKIVKGQTD